MVRKVSVILPALNEAESIASLIPAIQRVAAERQRSDIFEIVVVDDGSTDGTLEILRDFGAAIQLFERSHQGIGASYNFGVERSSGEILAFLESDDAWEPTYLEETVQLLRSGPEIAWVSTGRRVVDERAAPPATTSSGDWASRGAGGRSVSSDSAVRACSRWPSCSPSSSGRPSRCCP